MQTNTSSLDGQHVVVTPEHVEFHFVVAGLYSRMLAWFVDSLASTALALLLLELLSSLSIWSAGFYSAVSYVVWFLVYWGYSIFFELIWAGQTIGKRWLGLRAIQESGVRMEASQALLRNFMRPVDFMPAFYLVGGIPAFFSRSHQRLGDLLAGTIVVKEKKISLPSALERPEQDWSALKDIQLHLQVHQLSTDETELLLSSAMRRNELSMEARIRLFAALSDRLQSERGLQKPAHLSDEKWVLLVTHVVSERRALRKTLTKRAGPPEPTAPAR